MNTDALRFVVNITETKILEKYELWMRNAGIT